MCLPVRSSVPVCLHVRQSPVCSSVLCLSACMFFSLLFVRQSLSSCATCLYSCNATPISFVCMSVRQSIQQYSTAVCLFACHLPTFTTCLYICCFLLLLFCLYVCSPVTYLRVQHAATSAVRSVCPVTQHKAKPPRRAQTLRRAGETTEIRGGYIKWRDKLAENRVKKQ